MKYNDFCTGCCACLNICPKGAISMTEDEYGFVFPSIDEEKCVNCGLCDKVCDRIDALNKSYPLKSLAVSSKNTELSLKSSSGGMFAELAKFVLSSGGVVFGCAMEKACDKFVIKHISVYDEKDLYKLQGSKYVQSDIGISYLEAKKYLDENRNVLFSGTPCQIAGLKAFLNKDYENLLTVDLSCTGTPSLKIFNDYIKFLEQKYKQKIINFDFRNKKRFGWSCGNALITLQNGKQKSIFNYNSSYLNLFIRKKIQGVCCQNCKFVGLKRISDYTIADCWGFEKVYPSLLKENGGIFDKNIGISLVLINSERAIEYFKNINDNINCKDVNIERLKQYNGPLCENDTKDITMEYLEEYRRNGYNGLDKLYKKRQGTLKRFYYSILPYLPNFVKTFYKSFFSKKYYDCLFMTLYCLNNYGSLLTAFSLYKTIKKLGYNGKLIHYGNLYGYGKSFIKRYLPITNRCVNNKDFFKLNKISNTFILGSDNLINLETNYFPFVANCLFNYTDNDKKRIMISGSIGSWNGSTKNEEDHNYIQYLLDRFDYISTREEQGKNVFKNVYDVDSDWINDPVFYLEKQDFINLTKNINKDYSNSIMQYILYPTVKTDEIVNHYEQLLSSQVVKFDGNENVKYFSFDKNQSVENWLKAIKTSKLIITDSFHCVAFCLIFNKKFVCIKNSHATVRFTSLFNRLGINIPLIEDINDLETINFNYDKDAVNQSLTDIRNYALEKIQISLDKPIKNVTPNFEMDNFNKNYIKNNEKWYKRNRIFYFFVIVPIVIPVKKIWANIKNG